MNSVEHARTRGLRLQIAVDIVQPYMSRPRGRTRGLNPRVWLFFTGGKGRVLARGRVD